MRKSFLLLVPVLALFVGCSGRDQKVETEAAERDVRREETLLCKCFVREARIENGLLFITTTNGQEFDRGIPVSSSEKDNLAILVDPRIEGTAVEVISYTDFTDSGRTYGGAYFRTIIVKSKSDKQRWGRVIQEERDFYYKPRDVVPFRVFADRGLGNRPDVQKRVRTITP